MNDMLGLLMCDSSNGASGQAVVQHQSVTVYKTKQKKEKEEEEKDRGPSHSRNMVAKGFNNAPIALKLITSMCSSGFDSYDSRLLREA